MDVNWIKHRNLPPAPYCWCGKIATYAEDPGYGEIYLCAEHQPVYELVLTRPAQYRPPSENSPNPFGDAVKSFSVTTPRALKRALEKREGK